MKRRSAEFAGFNRLVNLLRNKAVFWLETVIFECLQLLRHNYVIGHKKSLISTLTVSTSRQVHYPLKPILLPYGYSYKASCARPG